MRNESSITPGCESGQTGQNKRRKFKASKKQTLRVLFKQVDLWLTRLFVKLANLGIPVYLGFECAL